MLIYLLLAPVKSQNIWTYDRTLYLSKHEGKFFLCNSSSYVSTKQFFTEWGGRMLYEVIKQENLKGCALLVEIFQNLERSKNAWRSRTQCLGIDIKTCLKHPSHGVLIPCCFYLGVNPGEIILRDISSVCDFARAYC